MKLPKQFLFSLYSECLKAAHPKQLLKKIKCNFDASSVILGAGKASYEMATAWIEQEKVKNPLGCLIVPEGHLSSISHHSMWLGVLGGGHPISTTESITSTRVLIDFVREQKGRRKYLFFLSGGASSLFESIVPGIHLKEFQATITLLLKSGATITEMNIIRKHLSRVKGGRFAEILGVSPCTTFVLSDVEGDAYEIIGSGPTYPDSSTYQEALKILKKLKIMEKTPLSIVNFLTEGSKKLHPETPKIRDPIFKRHQWILVGNVKSALEGGRKKAEILRLPVICEKKFLKGEAKQLGSWLARKGKRLRGPLVYLAGGEPTVHVRGKGNGGRCQEVALAFAIEGRGVKGMHLLAAGSDGIDGPTNAAGAYASNESFSKGLSERMDATKYLKENNSYAFFNKLGDLIKTGYTGTNVNDLFILYVP